MIRNKIGIIQLGRIGDMVLTTPIFKIIKDLFPNSILHVYAGPSNYSIIKNNPYIDKIIVIKKTPAALIKTIYNLKLNKYYYWIDPKDHQSRESKIIAWLVNAQKKVVYSENQTRASKYITLPVNTENLHHVMLGLNSLLPLGFIKPINVPKPELFTHPESEQYINEYLSTRKLKNFILLNISGSSEHKMWDNSSWIEFFKKICIKKEIVLCFGPPELERAIELNSKMKNMHIFHSRSIKDIASLVAKSDFIFTPDTAIVHIAAAFNKPIFALYSGLDHFYSKFYPLSDVYHAVRADQGDKGIKSISVEKAVSEFEKFYENHLSLFN